MTKLYEAIAGVASFVAAAAAVFVGLLSFCLESNALQCTPYMLLPESLMI
jgi:hypothetical protein